MTRELTRDEWAESLNTDFIFSLSPEYKVTMKLIEVTEEKEKHRQRTYVLTFAAPEDTPLAQGIAPFENEKLGQGDVFIVPVGKDKRGMLFESVFNKLVEAEDPQ